MSKQWDITREVLYDLYRVKGMTMMAIAERYGVHHSTVDNALKRMEIEKWPRGNRPF